MEYAASKMIGRRIDKAAHQGRLRAARSDKRKILKQQLFDLKMLNTLRTEYASAPDKISTESYKQLATFLDGVAKHNQPLIIQLANAGIKYVSALARNRIKKVDVE